MQDKLQRTLVLPWLWQCIHSYLVRFAATASRDRLHRWLEKAVRPVLTGLKKSSFFTFPQQLVSSGEY